MDPQEFKKGAKYFSNVEKVLQSIKTLNSNSSLKVTTQNEKTMMNMIKSLATIVDTQNDILKYIVSHDSKAVIDDEDSDSLTVGQYVEYIPYETIAIIREIKGEIIKIHVIASGTDLEVNFKDIK